MFHSLLRRLTKKHSPLKLGRWSLKPENSHTANINAVLNAADHCGDHICGNPSLVNELITNKHVSNYAFENDYCCMLLGLNTCGKCILVKKNIK